MSAPRRPWRALVRREEPTGPLPIVERLRGTPYSEPSRLPIETDSAVRQALDFALRVADLLLRGGAGTAEVEASVIAVVAALGLDVDAVDVDVTHRAVVLGYAPPGAPPVALVRVCRTSSRDYARLAGVHALVADLVAGRLDRSTAALRLRTVERARAPWPRWLVTLAWGAVAAASVVRLGGTAAEATVAFVSAAVVDRVGRLLTRTGLAPFFVTAIGAGLGTGLAMLAVAAHLPVTPAVVVAGGIIVLLPGLVLVSAVQDGINGFPVTGMARVFSGLLATGAILAGLAAALYVAGLLGASISVGRGPSVSTVGEAAVRLPATALAAACSALAGRGPRRLLLPAAAAGGLGYVVYDIVQRLGDSVPLATAAAGLAIGCAGRVLALRRGASPLTVVVPAITPLLPGLSIFESMRQLTAHSAQAANGVVTLLGAATLALALGAGVVLGDQLATPVERGLDVATRARRHRRPAG